MNRIEVNNRLLEILREFLCKNPQLRFIQALWALQIIDRSSDLAITDRFYEESIETLKRIGYSE